MSLRIGLGLGVTAGVGRPFLPSSWVYAGVAGVVAHLDWINRRYYWGGQARQEGEIPVLLNPSWGPLGVTFGTTAKYARWTLAELGMNADPVEGTAVISYVAGTLGSFANYLQMSDLTNDERIYFQNNSTPLQQWLMFDGGAAQGTMSDFTNLVAGKHASGHAFKLDDREATFDLNASTRTDAGALMPTMTHLQIGGGATLGPVGHVVLFNSRIPQADLLTATADLYALQVAP